MEIGGESENNGTSHGSLAPSLDDAMCNFASWLFSYCNIGIFLININPNIESEVKALNCVWLFATP